MKKIPLKDLVTAHLRRQFGSEILEGDDGANVVDVCLKAIEMSDSGNGTRVINNKRTAEDVIHDAKLNRFLKKH